MPSKLDRNSQSKVDLAIAEGNADSARKVPPSKIVMERRIREANGRPDTEAVDTIGRMWCWGLLDGGRYDGELLRDAGRRFATFYWRRYGPVCAMSGHYEEMIGGGSIRPVFINDPEADEQFEARFNIRDAALLKAGCREFDGRSVVSAVHQACVNHAGENDPGWLTNLMNGYPVHTAEERDLLARRAKTLAEAKGKDARRRAKRLYDDARRDLERRLREFRRQFVPHLRVRALIAGLEALAEIDRSEGLHRRVKRTRLDENPD